MQARGAQEVTSTERWVTVARREAANPIFSFYRCRDGRWLHLSAFRSNNYWGAFCGTPERPEWEHDRRFETAAARAEDRRELVALIDPVFAERTVEVWQALLRA